MSSLESAPSATSADLTIAFDPHLTADAVAGCLDRDDRAAAEASCEALWPADIAEVVALLEPRHRQATLTLLDLDERAEVFSHLPPAVQVELVAGLGRDELGKLLERLPGDDRADLYNRLPDDERERILPALAHAEREDLRRLSSYPEGTAGAIMTSEYATLEPALTARDAMEALRRVAPAKETIYNSYVIDPERRLLGVVSLRDLITAAPLAQVEDLMERHVISARVDEDQERVANLIARYDLVALPILDGEGKLVGIVTADDAMDVAAEEATEDFHKHGTVGKLATSVKDASVTLLYRKRITWLIVLVFGNLFSGAAIAHFEEVIATYVALVFFLPLLIDSGGNAGSQSATLMVRALATGDVAMRDWARMLGREVTVAALLGVSMALAVSLIGLVRAGPEIALVVSATMVCTVLVGSIVGMSLPFLLTKLRVDPATASAPLITSIADASGVLIYFAIASAWLPALAG